MQQTPDLHPALNYSSPTDLTHIFKSGYYSAIVKIFNAAVGKIFKTWYDNNMLDMTLVFLF